MSEIYLIGGMMLVTFSIRYTLFAVSGRIIFPPQLIRALRYVPPTVLAAITVPAVLIPSGDHINFSVTNAHLVGAVVAFAVGWFSRNMLLTIVGGMLGFFLWQLYL